MPISNRDLPAGTKLVARYKGESHSALVLGDGEDGTPQGYELNGQTIYKSLSSAGSAVMGGTACNGWRFWSVEGEEPAPAANAERAEKPAKAKAAAKAKAPAKVRLIKRTPNQQGVADGSTKWFCSACMKSFVAEGASEPDCCPEGHCKEVEDEFATGD